MESVLTIPALVPQNMVADEWPRCAEHIQSAMSRNGRYEPGFIRQACMDGKMQLWTVYDGDDIKATCVTEILQYPTMKVLSIIVLTGEDRESWIRHAEYLKQYGRQWGCRRAEAWARPGWSRVLKDWRHTHSLLEIEL